MRCLFFCALLLVACSGCVTATIWSSANASTVQISGVSANCQSRMLVVRYAHGHERSTLLVPLLTNGRPSSPFAYEGPAISADEILAEISANQRQAILHAAGNVIEGDGPVKASSERRRCTDPPDPNEDFSIYSSSSTNGWALIPYRLHGNTIELADLPCQGQMESTRQQLEHDVRKDPPFFAIVPAERPRPAPARRREQLVATALTPLTVPTDVVLGVLFVIVYPPVWLYVQIFWPNGGC